MIIGSVNGWPLVAMPITPGPRQVDWKPRNLVGTVTAAFTGKQQTQNWQSGWMEATVTLPPMQRTSAAAWMAFLLQCQGQNGVFMFGDGLATAPLGSAEGMGVINGIFQGPYSLTTNGWTPNQSMLLQPGDWVQVGYRMYQNQNVVSSDGAGNASLSVWPNIREIPAPGTPIVTSNPQGLFRLATNDPGWSESYQRTWMMSFQIREAI
jgi:hypothetical protein